MNARLFETMSKEQQMFWLIIARNFILFNSTDSEAHRTLQTFE
jgi:hypothetical protein